MSSEYVAAMEDVLDVYALPLDHKHPQVCFDERPVQLIGEVYEPLPPQPGRVGRYDYEYERNGTANLFVMCQPLVGWRDVQVTDQRTKVDFAHCMKDLAEHGRDRNLDSEPLVFAATHWRQPPATSCCSQLDTAA